MKKLLCSIAMMLVVAIPVYAQDDPNDTSKKYDDRSYVVTKWVAEVIGYGGRIDEQIGIYDSYSEASAASLRWSKNHPESLKLTREREVKVRVTPPSPARSNPALPGVEPSNSPQPGVNYEIISDEDSDELDPHPEMVKQDEENDVNNTENDELSFSTPFTPEVISLRRRGGESYKPRDYTNDPYVTSLRNRPPIVRPQAPVVQTPKIPTATVEPEPSNIRYKNGYPISPDHLKIPGYRGPRWVNGRLVAP
ncbi:hypothetical protein [uncultured Rubinisphaera sp.]|uniref:hypothetical protein n=1 Tax=uncultured Rubinisphaera sp. TaxID=1678686 RepID=UPI0026B7812F|tara:strand:- start:1465 stop:2217 length:753 start_codon:yes stop_codon:yes gene_type:complete